MIELLQYAKADDLPNYSPFCMKVETYLRMSGIAYTNVTQNSPMGMPHKKLPVIRDRGQLVADSNLIQDYLINQYGDSLDKHLKPEQQALGQLVKQTLEKHFYFCLLYFRWQLPEGWAVTEPHFFGFLPFPMRHIVPFLARRGQLERLQQQGVGRLPKDKVLALAAKDLGAIADVLGNQSFLLGTKPSSFDAVAFAFLANVRSALWSNDLAKLAQKEPVFERYVARMTKRYFA